MNATVNISDINHEDLVNLFSTALYGNSKWYADYNRNEYKHKCETGVSDCIEDKFAKLLLAGCSIEISDRYAEDKTDGYGKVMHAWDKENECMVYNITLEDVRKGLNKASRKGYHKIVMDLANEPENLDMFDADLLLQFIVFGDYIYG